MESWAQVRFPPYMARSQITLPPSEVTLVETLKSVTERLALNDWRELPEITTSWGPGAGPVEVMKVRSTVTGSGLGFCTSIQVSKSPAVHPSARYQVVEGGKVFSDRKAHV